MQFKLFALATVAFFTLAAATPTRRNDPSQCNSGSLQCCSSVESATDPSLTTVFGLLGIVVQDVTGEVGVTCSPITVIGAGSTSCTDQSVCCTDNSFKGVVALGCTPINL